MFCDFLTCWNIRPQFTYMYMYSMTLKCKCMSEWMYLVTFHHWQCVHVVPANISSVHAWIRIPELSGCDSAGNRRVDKSAYFTYFLWNFDLFDFSLESENQQLSCFYKPDLMKQISLISSSKKPERSQTEEAEMIHSDSLWMQQVTSVCLLCRFPFSLVVSPILPAADSPQAQLLHSRGRREELEFEPWVLKAGLGFEKEQKKEEGELQESFHPRVLFYSLTTEQVFDHKKQNKSVPGRLNILEALMLLLVDLF